jgi:uncharacterized RDD family membrane protein YckC
MWFYSLDTKPIGPVAEAELDQLSHRGIVRWDTFIWSEGMAQWKPYGAIFQRESVHCSQCHRKTLPDVATGYGDGFICLDCHDLFFQKIWEGCHIPGLIQFGGFWLRFVAKIIDGVALAVLQIPLLIATIPLSVHYSPAVRIARGESAEGAFGPYVAIQAASLLIRLLLALGYNTFFVGKFGATPGKLCLGLQTVRSDFTQISYRTALLRSLAEMISYSLCYLGYIMAAFDDQKRALHDHLCHTRVVKKKSLEYAKRQVP